VSKQIKKIFPNALVEGNRIPPRSGAFEITLDKILVFSKLKSHRFPMENELKDILSD
jgi:selT/selW/selH-like putative selenoprotein